jgi:acyl-CoA thioesterase I
MKPGIVARLLLTAIVFAVGSAPGQTKVACIGNSITAGYPASYVPVLAQLLGAGYQVENAGVGGTTLLRNGNMPYWNQGRLPQVFAFKPDIITIKLGTNDSKSMNWDVHGGEFKRDYEDLIDTLNTIMIKPKIFLVLPTPAFTTSYDIREDNLNLIREIIVHIASERGLNTIDCHTPLLNHPELFHDGVHPNGAGADSIGHLMYRGILGTSTPLVNVVAASTPVYHVLSATARGLSIWVPSKSAWTLELFGLNGTRTATHTGMGSKEIPLKSGGFVAARITAKTGVLSKLIVGK